MTLLGDESPTLSITTAGSPVTPVRSTMRQALRDATLGEYEILSELGRGGMATVFLAHDIALDRKVAIKVMAPHLLEGEGMAERFKLEARTAAQLSHPHIIPIYAVPRSGRCAACSTVRIASSAVGTRLFFTPFPAVLANP
jgi:serine/threonine-protein kinase